MEEQIVQYKDTVNKKILEGIKTNLNNLCINYNNLANPKSIANRESCVFEDYALQYKNDIVYLTALRNCAQEIADQAIKSLYTISMRSISKHLFNDELSNC